MRRTALLFAAPFALALAACDGWVTGPGDASLSATEAREVAVAWDGVAGGVVTQFLMASHGVVGPSGAFKRQHACPGGGVSTVEGQRVVTHDPATRSGSAQVNATRTDSACTFPARARRGVTVTITGSPNIQLATNGTWTNGVAGVHTHTQKGSFTWSRSTGGTGTCTVDLTGTFNSASMTRTLTGTLCGRAVSVSHTMTDH